ncbi:MAG: extracellular solute-binding protein [Alphaproteobacteria bacterium]|jgi:ABC-type glycerol-3-phosphate transport system substrate-binding protein|nr:extracellular solute-binding protein [Alphaproteobacteria bacterium]
MKLKTILMAGALSVAGSVAAAECAFENTTELRSLTAGFEAWKAVTDAMAECGNFEANLDQEFREKQPEAFAAEPSLYHIGGVSNSTMIPLLNAGTIRPLNDLVEKHGQHLKPNQLITVDGDIMAVAMMVNNQHLMYRTDIFEELDLEAPTTYDEYLEAAAVIEEADVVQYPLGGTFKSGWNLGEEFVNMFLAHGGTFVDDNNMPTINNEKGLASLEQLKATTEYLDPEYLASDSTYVQQQFQQGQIAMANLWASRAGAMNDPEESQVVGKVTMASAPMGPEAPVSSIWWDGIVIAANITDEEAEAAFRVAMEGMDTEMVQANPEAAVWLVDGYEPGEIAAGAAATAANGARPYPASSAMGIMHSVLGNGIAAYLNGDKDAETTLADIEAAYMTSAKEAGLID